jgi:uncharacterized protein DUF6916
MRDLASLTVTDFEAILGSPFQVVDAQGHAVLSLSLVRVIRHPERPGHRQPFSLRWAGPPTPLLAQHTHQLTHPELGDIEIFLGPIAADATAATYEAVFT